MVTLGFVWNLEKEKEKKSNKIFLLLFGWYVVEKLKKHEKLEKKK